ncbi:MAG: hypothetical protein ACP5RD_00585 [bacterium]
MFSIKKFIEKSILVKNNSLSIKDNNLLNKDDNLVSNEIYEINYNDDKNMKKRFRFLRIFVEDKEDNTKVNISIPLIFFPFAIFFKGNPNIVDIVTKDSIVKIYLE